MGVIDPTSGNNVATDTDTLTARAELSISKDDGQASAVPGTRVTYQVVVSNTGPSDAPGTAVTDTLPAVFTDVTWTCAGSGGGTCAAGGVGDIGDTSANLRVGSVVTYTITGTVSAGAAGSLVNTATVTAGPGVTDPTLGDNAATDTDTLSPEAALSISKNDGQTSAVPGTQVTYQVVVSNTGPSNAPGATVSDTMPAVLTGVTWTCAGAGGGTCAASGSGNIDDSTANLPSGAVLTYTITGTVPANATGSLANTATVTAPSGVTDTTPDDNVASDIDTLSPQVELSISKDDRQTGAVPGTDITYQIVVSNTGPSDAPGTRVTDTLLATLGGVVWTCAGSGGRTCEASGVDDIDDAVDLPSGAVVTYTITGTVSANATGNLVNTASVAAPTGVTDPTPGDNTATDADLLTPRAELSISKEDGQSTTVPGTRVTYRVVVSNTGPSDAPGTTVTDTLPATLTGVVWTCAGSGTGTCTASGAGDIEDTTVSLPVGSVVTYTITGTVSSSATGSLANTAMVAASSAVTDPIPGNNTATDTDTLSPRAALSVSKDDGQSTAVPGTQVRYQIVVSNTGPSDAPATTVVDKSPSALVGVTWTCGGFGGATCAASGVGDISDSTANLPVGSVVTYTLTGTVASSATGSLVNTSVITAPFGVTDPITDDNTAMDTDALAPQAALSISKDDGLSTAVPGTQVRYQVVVSNTGPSDAPGTAVTDTLPGAFSAAVWTCTGFGGGTCAATGSGDIDDATVDLPSGGVVTYTITGTVSASATGSLVNIAAVAAAAGVTDPTPGDNVATDTDTLTPRAELSISKDNGQSTSVPGTQVAYRVVVSNTGPSDAPGATVTDTMPAVLTGVTWTCAGSGGGSCVAGGADNIDGALNLPSGGVVTYTITGTVSASATGHLANTAAVTAPLGVTDPTPGDNSVTDTDTLTPHAQLSIFKDDGQTSVTAGLPLTYTIVVSNAGPSDVTDATVADQFPVGLTGATWSCTGSGGGTCLVSGSGSIDDGGASLPVGGVLTYTVRATVDPSVRGILTNTAQVTVPVGATDPEPGDNRSTDADRLTSLVSLTVSQSGSVDPAIAGSGTGNLTYVITVTNRGPSNATGLLVTEALTLPVGTTVESITPGSGSFVSPTWTIPGLTVGESGVLTVTLTVGPRAPTGIDIITSTASVSSVDETLAPGKFEASVRTSVLRHIDLAITKTVAVAMLSPGNAITYELTFDNSGPSVAAGVRITDRLPITVTNAIVEHAGAAITAAGGSRYVWEIADLLPGQGGIVTITGQVDPSLTRSTTFTNSVEISGQEIDIDPSSNADSAAVYVPIVDLVLDKSVSSSSAGPGTPITYTLTLTNDSATDATGVVISDVLPSGLTLIGSVTANGGYNADVWTLTSDLPGRRTSTLEILARVNSGTAGSVFTNTARIQSADQFDPFPNNNTDSATLRILSANLSITKTAPVTVTPGLDMVYAITVTNAGPDAAEGAIVSDTLPAEILGAEWSCTPQGGATCASGTGDIRDLADLPSGASLAYEIRGTTSSAATGTVINSAEVIAPNNIDPDTSDNLAQATTTMEPQADLYVTKHSTRDRKVSAIQYNVVVGNHGPSDATGVVVSDTMPAEVSSDAWTCQGSGGGLCGAANGSGNIFESLSLPAGAVITYHVAADLTDVGATVVNAATITVPAGVYDPNDVNNRATDRSTGLVYLPSVLRGYVIAPDLVVETLFATSKGLTVTIRNRGSAAVVDSFWVDAYFDPSVRPPRINQPWNTIAAHGAVWGVTVPIPAGSALTLTTQPADPYYFERLSSPPPWPVGARVYVYVDSVDFRTTYGAVQESDEANNVLGPVTSTATQGLLRVAGGQDPSARGLPPRR